MTTETCLYGPDCSLCLIRRQRAEADRIARGGTSDWRRARQRKYSAASYAAHRDARIRYFAARRRAAR